MKLDKSINEYTREKKVHIKLLYLFSWVHPSTNILEI